MSLKKIKVAIKQEGIILRDPVSRNLVTTDGIVVEKTPFWIRRLKDGDCVLIEESNAPETLKGVEDDNSVQRDSDDT